MAVLAVALATLDSHASHQATHDAKHHADHADHHAEHHPARRFVRHTVRRGDTISDLARHYRLSPATLLRDNDLDRFGRIYAGQHLRIPAAAVRSAARHGRAAVRTLAYRIKPGDTVSELARRYGLSQSAILKANHLDARGFIRAGATLRLPLPAHRAPARSDAHTAAAATFAGRSYPSATGHAAEVHRRELAGRRVPSRSATRALIAATARRYGVDPALALAVAWQESGWNQRQVSVADAIGTMQVIPDTGDWASSLAGRRLNLLDTADNVTAGVLVLHALLAQAPTRDAVAGYYQGLASVHAHGMYQDTTAYVRNVLALRARFA